MLAGDVRRSMESELLCESDERQEEGFKARCLRSRQWRISIQRSRLDVSECPMPYSESMQGATFRPDS